MRNMLWAMILTLSCLSSIGSKALAQEKQAEAAAAPSSGPRAEFLTELKVEQDKFIKLAEAIPADKYTWRPTADARSVSEVYLHVAAANYNLPKLIGTPPPAGFKVEGFDKSTIDKTKVVQSLTDSFTHLRQAVVAMPDTNLEKELDWFGGKNTQRGILLFMMRHMAEHLGQSIAYARSNNIVPPWTEEQRQKAKQQKK